MNIDIRDAQVVRTLRALEVASYLRVTGWTQRESTSKASIWERTIGDREYEIVVPLEQSVGDYALRMGEVLQTLAVAEHRSQLRVLSDLQTSFADIVRIRIDDPDFRNGTLPIEDHTQIAKSLEALFLAVARAVAEQSPVRHTEQRKKAAELVSKIRIGQSEPDGYTFTVISRVSPALRTSTNGEPPETEQPYERQIILTLASSLESLERAASEAALSGEIGSFETAIEHGLRVDFCEALTGFWGSEDGERSLTFDFTWSPSRPVESRFPSSSTFGPDRISVIREAIQKMKTQPPIPDFELEGVVVRLDRAPGKKTGTVTILGQVNDKQRRVSVELEHTEYDLVHEAHRTQQVLRVIGVLVRVGSRFELRNPQIQSPRATS